MHFFRKLLNLFLIKKIYLKIYFFLYNSITFIKHYYRHIINPILVKKQIKKGYLNIYLNSDWLGFGARLVKTIELLYFAKFHNVELNIEYGYNEKVNRVYFANLFKPVSSKLFSHKKSIRIQDISEIATNIDLNKQLSLKIAHKLFHDNYKLNDSIESELNLFTNEYFLNSKVLGVHYRGTDKEGEAPRLMENNLIDEINKCLIDGSFSKIFISTDEFKVLELIKKSFNQIPVIYREDAYRSIDGEQFHRKKENDKDNINYDALMNILLLSKTDFLIKTASIMSDCSFIFNPHLRYKILSTPHNSNLTWWPATELIEKSL
jgi:hypothetical protein